MKNFLKLCAFLLLGSVMIILPNDKDNRAGLYLYCQSDNVTINSFYLTVVKGNWDVPNLQDFYTPQDEWRNTRKKQSNGANPWVDNASDLSFVRFPISLNISGGGFKGETIQYGKDIGSITKVVVKIYDNYLTINTRIGNAILGAYNPDGSRYTGPPFD